VIAVRCPQCQRELQIPVHFAGTTGKCRHCGNPLKVPHLDVNEAFLDAQPEESTGEALQIDAPRHDIDLGKEGGTKPIGVFRLPDIDYIWIICWLLLISSIVFLPMVIPLAGALAIGIIIDDKVKGGDKQDTFIVWGALTIFTPLGFAPFYLTRPIHSGPVRRVIILCCAAAFVLSLYFWWGHLSLISEMLGVG
jgi:hypothetical protein